MDKFSPAYQKLFQSGELHKRAEAARKHLSACDLCARHCGVNRLQGQLGACRMGLQARLASYGPHHGEEAPLRGWRGSGTIFFSGCNLYCVYCQNHDISQTRSGREVTPQELAGILLLLQEKGCHNINLVSPSHVVAQILETLPIAARQGLELPLVYNSGGYDSTEALALLDGIIDIYMPDMKYSDSQTGLKLSGVPDYPQVNRAAVKEMFRQVGDLQINAEKLAERGLLVRHLVLPENLAGTREILSFLAEEISENTYVNIMDQYHPAYQAADFPPLNRPLEADEYKQALKEAQTYHLNRLDKRILWL